MIRLALAIGFLAVFGFVAYTIVVLLVNRFKNKEDNNQSNNSNEKQTKTNANDGN